MQKRNGRRQSIQRRIRKVPLPTRKSNLYHFIIYFFTLQPKPKTPTEPPKKAASQTKPSPPPKKLDPSAPPAAFSSATQSDVIRTVHCALHSQPSRNVIAWAPSTPCSSTAQNAEISSAPRKNSKSAPTAAHSANITDPHTTRKPTNRFAKPSKTRFPAVISIPSRTGSSNTTARTRRARKCSTISRIISTSMTAGPARKPRETPTKWCTSSDRRWIPAVLGDS